MSEDNIFRKIIARLSALRQPSQPFEAAPQNGGMMDNLLHMLGHTEEVELSCDDVYELLDRYVDLEISGEDAAALLPLVKTHLNNCRDCREEYEALIRIVEASSESPG